MAVTQKGQGWESGERSKRDQFERPAHVCCLAALPCKRLQANSGAWHKKRQAQRRQRVGARRGAALRCAEREPEQATYLEACWRVVQRWRVAG